VSYRYSEFNVTHSLSTHLLLSNFNSTAIADDTTITDSLILTAVALVVFSRTEDLLTEKSVSLRLISPIVDGFWLQYLSRRPFFDVFWRSKSDTDPFEIAFNLVFFAKSRHISKISIVCN
jgi:hypothetical protein